MDRKGELRGSVRWDGTAPGQLCGGGFGGGNIRSITHPLTHGRVLEDEIQHCVVVGSGVDLKHDACGELVSWVVRWLGGWVVG